METLRSPSVITLIKPSKKIRMRDPARAMNSRLEFWSVTGDGGLEPCRTNQKSLPRTGILTMTAVDDSASLNVMIYHKPSFHTVQNIDKRRCTTCTSLGAFLAAREEPQYIALCRSLC